MAELYPEIGGTAACRKLAVAFYGRVARDPILRPLFPGKTFTCAIEEFSAFLVHFLGGPAEDAQKRWRLSLRESHQRFRIGTAERDAWLAIMTQALDDVPIAEPMRTALLDFFGHSSVHVLNQAGGETIAKPPLSTELSTRWAAQLRLEEAVAAVRGGHAPRAIALAEATPGRSVFTGLLALMIRSGQRSLLDYVEAKLTDDPTLARERYAARTLLHEAAAAGNLSLVESLLTLGADPNVQDGGSHTPLYSVANQCAVEGAAAVVRALIQAGAQVDACEGVKRCTPLHMAARRDHVEIAGALLDCGADIEARDSQGETPLRRAVNCNQVGVAALLLARGANPHSAGSKGVTPARAARSAAMKRLLQK